MSGPVLKIRSAVVPALISFLGGRPKDLRLRRSREQVVGDGRVGAQQVRAETGRGLVRHLHAVLKDLRHKSACRYGCGVGDRGATTRSNTTTSQLHMCTHKLYHMYTQSL